MLFDGWPSIGRVVLLALGTYVLIITALRVAGAQALAKMSAYDLVITIALGSVVATIPLSSGVTLADGIAVVVTYLVLQALMRTSLKKWPAGRRVAKNSPALVLWDGRLLAEPMRRVNVTEGEVRAAVRKAGIASFAQLQAVVLENDGEWSVVRRTEGHELTALRDVNPATSDAAPS
jgi:uncharacterized membrane protein YcaP (DUF421 family)